MVFWNGYDVLNAFIGGAFMSVATTFHLLVRGRVTGFSGIYYSLITLDPASFLWKLTLMSAIVMVSAGLFKGYGFTDPLLFDGANPAFDTPKVMLEGVGVFGFSIAGFLVGLGTKLSNGCTSGHGICGLARLSIRSLVAVSSFMGFAFITASIKQFVPNDDALQVDKEFIEESNRDISTVILTASITIIVMCAIFQYLKDKKGLIDILVGFLTGGVFGVGLVVSGMNKRSKILGFLTINEDWDPSLAFVMGGAVGINILTFYLIIHKVKKPIMGEKLEIPSNNKIDLKLVVGASIFGIGWGVGGLCPGPAFTLLTLFSFEISVLFLFFLGVGQYTAVFVDKTFFNSACPIQVKPKEDTQQQQNDKQEEQQLKVNDDNRPEAIDNVSTPPNGKKAQSDEQAQQQVQEV